MHEADQIHGEFEKGDVRLGNVHICEHLLLLESFNLELVIPVLRI